MSDEYTPGKAHEDLAELIWANVPAWDYPTDVDRLAEAIDRFWLPRELERLRADARVAWDDRDAALQRLGEVVAEAATIRRLHEEATERLARVQVVVTRWGGGGGSHQALSQIRDVLANSEQSPPYSDTRKVER